MWNPPSPGNSLRRPQCAQCLVLAWSLAQGSRLGRPALHHHFLVGIFRKHPTATDLPWRPQSPCEGSRMACLLPSSAVVGGYCWPPWTQRVRRAPLRPGGKPPQGSPGLTLPLPSRWNRYGGSTPVIAPPMMASRLVRRGRAQGVENSCLAAPVPRQPRKMRPFERQATATPRSSACGRDGPPRW